MLIECPWNIYSTKLLRERRKVIQHPLKSDLLRNLSCDGIISFVNHRFPGCSNRRENLLKTLNPSIELMMNFIWISINHSTDDLSVQDDGIDTVWMSFIIDCTEKIFSSIPQTRKQKKEIVVWECFCQVLSC